MIIKARVVDGRMVVDEPTSLPDGAEVHLLMVGADDWLSEPERAALHAGLLKSDADVAADRLTDADDILKGLRSR